MGDQRYWRCRTTATSSNSSLHCWLFFPSSVLRNSMLGSLRRSAIVRCWPAWVTCRWRLSEIVRSFMLRPEISVSLRFGMRAILFIPNRSARTSTPVMQPSSARNNRVALCSSSHTVEVPKSNAWSRSDGSANSAPRESCRRRCCRPRNSSLRIAWPRRRESQLPRGGKRELRSRSGPCSCRLPAPGMYQNFLVPTVARPLGATGARGPCASQPRAQLRRAAGAASWLPTSAVRTVTGARCA